jgi:hypothetical protein
MSIRGEIVEFYSSGKEIGRLMKGIGPLEMARTQQLMLRCLPHAPAIVWDVGCGPGVYSLWLASHGYRMHLVDPVPLHIKHAMRAAEEKSLAFAKAPPGWHRTSRRTGRRNPNGQSSCTWHEKWSASRS